MSLAGATGAWHAGFGDPLPPQQVVLAGVRGSLDEFDGAGRAAADASPVTVLPASATIGTDILACLGDAAVYVHLDPDVLDPSENPISYARPGGLRLDQLAAILQGVALRGPVLGVEITALHTDDRYAQRRALADRLLDIVVPLLSECRRHG